MEGVGGGSRWRFAGSEDRRMLACAPSPSLSPPVVAAAYRGSSHRGGGFKRRTARSNDRRMPVCKKTCPPRTGGVKLEPEEMIRILEEIARDEEANPTSRVTAIRALRLFPEPLPLDESLVSPGQRLADDGTRTSRWQTTER